MTVAEQFRNVPNQISRPHFLEPSYYTVSLPSEGLFCSLCRFSGKTEDIIAVWSNLFGPPPEIQVYLQTNASHSVYHSICKRRIDWRLIIGKTAARPVSETLQPARSLAASFILQSIIVWTLDGCDTGKHCYSLSVERGK